jgi:tetratricopeptide (TPR) repeat protein
MKSDAIAYGVAGIMFGLLAGWIIGSQQAKLAPPPAPVAAAQQSAPAEAPAVLDETQVAAFKTVAEKEPKNPLPRVGLGNMYFDAARYDEAIKWYSEALKLSPKDADISTDLGYAYFAINEPDRALEQFDRSLTMNPKHLKTLWNIGVVRARGKQDLQGAQAAWEKLVEIAPDSVEGQNAKRALEAIRSSHPGAAGAPNSGN